MAREMKYCPTCGVVSRPVMRQRGSLGVEVVLWLICGIGVLYTLWRFTTRGRVCAKCGSAGVIPVDSPRAVADVNRVIYDPSMPWIDQAIRVVWITAAVLFSFIVFRIAPQKLRGVDSGPGQITAAQLAERASKAEKARKVYGLSTALMKDLLREGVFRSWRKMSSSVGIGAVEVVVGRRFYGLDYEDKLNFVRAAAALPDSGRSQAIVILRDAGTNKKIGTYSPELGLSLE